MPLRARSGASAGGALLLLALPLLRALAAAARSAGASDTAGARPPGLRLEAGSVARQQIVAVGRDVVVDGEALRRRDGARTARSTVTGTRARRRDGARRRADPGFDRASSRATCWSWAAASWPRGGSRLSGRAVAYPTVSRAWLTLLEGPSLGLRRDVAARARRQARTGRRLAGAHPAALRLRRAAAGRTSEEVQHEPLRCFAAGLVGAGDDRSDGALPVGIPADAAGRAAARPGRALRARAQALGDGGDLPQPRQALRHPASRGRRARRSSTPPCSV